MADEMAVEMAVVCFIQTISIELAAGVGVRNSCHPLIPSYPQIYVAIDKVLGGTKQYFFHFPKTPHFSIHT